jgi:SAM-dependent methyltransferase
MLESTASMAASSSSPYPLGRTDAEHQRLIRQSEIFNPFTERLFRDAGLGPGQRILDIGSGLGDVSMLAARLVGTTGTVVGVDCDAIIIAKAKARVMDAGLRNVEFVETELGQIAIKEPFEAIVGRLILEFLPDPNAIVKSLSRLLRPGGVLAIQDACWAPFLQLTANLPLRSKCAAFIYHAFQQSGANMDMELVLYRAFQLAGLPAPNMRIEIPAGREPDFARWVHDLFCSLRSRMDQHQLSHDEVGDLETLQQRLEAEAAAAKTFGSTDRPCRSLVKETVLTQSACSSCVRRQWF